MDWQQLAWLGAGLFVAGAVKGITGLGYATCVLPFLVHSVGLKSGMAIVLAPALAANMSIALAGGHLRDCLARFSHLYAAMLPGIGLGLWLLLWIDPRIAVNVLGAAMLMYSLLTVMRPGFALPDGMARVLLIPVGALNGVLAGLTGSQVIPLVPFMLALDLEPAKAVQAINIGVLLASAVLAIGLIAAGIMTPALLHLSVLAIVPALLGVSLGSGIRRKLPAARFRDAVLIVIGGSGLLMMLR